MKIKRLHFFLCLLILSLVAFLFRGQLQQHVIPFISRRNTVEGQVRKYGKQARIRLAPYFNKANVNYPPTTVVFLFVKKDKVLQVYAAGGDEKYRQIKTYPILAASGMLGPKLKEGDFQVPEGLYSIESLNPNSSYHLALRVNYPNSFDRLMAKHYHRENLGGDIMIHGSNCSIGCLAMGDEVSEDLFVLAHDTGLQRLKVIISPVDFRKNPSKSELPQNPIWIEQLYDDIKKELQLLPL